MVFETFIYDRCIFGSAKKNNARLGLGNRLEKKVGWLMVKKDGVNPEVTVFKCRYLKKKLCRMSNIKEVNKNL